MFKILTPVALFLLVAVYGPASVADVRCDSVFATQAPAKPYDPKRSWSQQTFEREFDSLGEFFIANKKLSDADKTTAFMKADMRRSLFKLQALSRMLQEQSPKFFEGARTQFKDMEDATGRLDLAFSLRKTADTLGDPRLVKFFEAREKKAQVDFVETMKKSGLWTQPEETVGQLKSSFAANGRWANGKAEKKYLIHIIEDYAYSVHEAVKKNEFDNADIEKGLHELRRRLRWVLIQVSSLNGMTTLQTEADLSKKISTLFSQTLQVRPAFIDSKYIKTVDALVTNPIVVPKDKLALIGDLVSQIGENKDKAEMQIYIHEALVQVGASQTQIDSIMKKLDTSLQSEHVDHQAMARQIQSELAENKLLKKFAESLEELN